jgi:tyrosine-protein kinase Etk/Wzc
VQERANISPAPLNIEGLDLHKLKMIVRSNLLWLALIVFATNIGTYFYLRWTKNVYEAESILKLDIKQDATGIGLENVIENQNLNIISGEIEQIRSKLFLNRVIDSLDIWTSYHFIGKVLTDEMYERSPFSVRSSSLDHAYLETPIYLNFTGAETFALRVNNNRIQGTIGQPVLLEDVELVVSKTPFYALNHDANYYFVLHGRESLLKYLETYSKVVPLNFEANTIRISFQDYNPTKTRDIVNKIDSVYLSYSNEQKSLTNKQKINWLNQELAQIESKMDAYENYFENFTLQNKSSNLNVDLEKTITMLYAIDSQRLILTRKLADLSVVIDQVTINNYSIPVSQRALLPELINKKLEELQTLTLQRDRLGLSYNENTFAFKQKERELEGLRNQLGAQLSDLRKSWVKNLAELKERQASLEQQFAAMPDKSTQFAKNQRLYKLNEEFYLSLMQSKAGFEILQAGTIPDFKILSSPGLPKEPIAPKRMLIYGVGLTSGFLLCIFFIGVLYVLNDKVTNLGEIERASDVPVLAIIPESRHTTQSPFHVIDNPKSMVSEAIRTLRTNLDFFAVSDNRKTISISSTIAGEGKSFLALNLGGVIAMSKKKVVLVDLDMRKARTQTPFPIPDPQKGMSTLLIGKYDIKDCIIPTGLENFDYIPAGPHPPNPSELLMNGDFTDVLQKLEALYEFVIVDTPPVGLVTDGIMAMKKTDVSIYIVRANYSRKDYLRNIDRLRHLHKLPNMSIVLNALPTDNKMYGYGYYEDKTPLARQWKNFFG